MKKRLLVLGSLVVVVAATVTCFNGKKNTASADSAFSEKVVVDESSKSVRQLEIEFMQNGCTDDELDIAYFLKMAENLKNEGLNVDEIVEQINKEAENEVPNNNSRSISDQIYRAIKGWKNLNDIEKKLYVTHPVAALQVNIASKRAAKYTYKTFDFNGLGDVTDAFRHAVWCALMARDIGPELAKEFSDAHENGYTDEELAQYVRDGNTGYAHKDMDLYNNQIGIAIGSKYNTDEEIVACVKSLLTNQRGKGLFWLND